VFKRAVDRKLSTVSTVGYSYLFIGIYQFFGGTHFMMYWDFNKDCHNKHRSHHRSRPDNALEDLVGKKVKINRGGPDVIIGKLLAVKSDYLVVWTKEGVVYVQLKHVKSITELSTTGGRTDGTRGTHGRTDGTRGDRDHRKPDFIKADNFRGVLKALEHKFVQVNTGGPEKVEGFLCDVKKDHILVVSDNKKIKIFIDHIRSIKKIDKKKRTDGTTGGTIGGTTGGKTRDAAGSAQAQAIKPAPIVPAKGRTALKRRASR
jgi:spore coat protein B